MSTDRICEGRRLRCLAYFAVVLGLLQFGVAVHAVTSPMPYRPGYGLGSWIPPQVIAGMKKEAYARSAILLSENMISAATSLQRTIKIEQRSASNPMAQMAADAAGPGDDPNMPAEFIHKAGRARSRAYETLLDSMDKQVDQLMEAADTGIAPLEAFSTFASAAESPVDWAASKIGSVDRAFDSITCNSLLLTTDDVQSLTAASRSNSSGGRADSAQRKLLSLLENSKSTAFAGEVQEQLSRAYRVRAVEKTLILSSFATHRKVKQFTSLTVDSEKLRKSWNYFHGRDAGGTIPETHNNAAAFYTAFAAALLQEQQQQGGGGGSGAPSAVDKIAMVSEMFLGSSLVGFVHFMKVDKSSSSAGRRGSRLDVASRMRFMNFLDASTGSTKASKAASEEFARSASSSALEVEFDLVSLGYIPLLKSQKVLTGARDIVRHQDVAGSSRTEQGAKGQTEQQDNAKAVTEGVISSLDASEKSTPVLGIESFMDAFDDYAKAAHERPDEIGAPVGMNVKEWTMVDVMAAIADDNFGGHKSLDGGSDGADEPADADDAAPSPPSAA